MQSGNGRNQENLGVLLKQLAIISQSDGITAECPSCKLFSKVGSTEVVKSGENRIIGWKCQHCDAFIPKYVETPKLLKMQEKLQRYMAAASRGGKFLARYQKYRAMYNKAFDEVQSEIMPSFIPETHES